MGSANMRIVALKLSTVSIFLQFRLYRKYDN